MTISLQFYFVCDSIIITITSFVSTGTFCHKLWEYNWIQDKISRCDIRRNSDYRHKLWSVWLLIIWVFILIILTLQRLLQILVRSWIGRIQITIF